MRPIMSKEVCARLRNISVYTVRMNQHLTGQKTGTGRQISPVGRGEIGSSVSLLFREPRDCMHWSGLEPAARRVQAAWA